MYSGTSGLFFKRFCLPSPTQDCSKVLQGNLFGDIVKSGDSFDEHENVVSKFDHAMFDTSPDVQYVVALNSYNSLGVSFDSLEESFFLPSYC